MDPQPTTQAGEQAKVASARRTFQVNLGRQGDGCVFALHPLTRASIQERFPGSCQLRSVFVGTRTAGDLLDDRERLARLFRRVLEILTEMDYVDLLALGDFRLIDPMADETLFSTSPLGRPPAHRA